MLNKGSGGEQTPTVSGASLILEEKRNSNEIRPKQRGQEIEIAVSERILAYHSFFSRVSRVSGRIRCIQENSSVFESMQCIQEFQVINEIRYGIR